MILEPGRKRKSKIDWFVVSWWIGFLLIMGGTSLLVGALCYALAVALV